MYSITYLDLSFRRRSTIFAILLVLHGARDHIGHILHRMLLRAVVELSALKVARSRRRHCRGRGRRLSGTRRRRTAGRGWRREEAGRHVVGGGGGRGNGGQCL